jgi:hypothetical protein
MGSSSGSDRSRPGESSPCGRHHGCSPDPRWCLSQAQTVPFRLSRPHPHQQLADDGPLAGPAPLSGGPVGKGTACVDTSRGDERSADAHFYPRLVRRWNGRAAFRCEAGLPAVAYRPRPDLARVWHKRQRPDRSPGVSPGRAEGTQTPDPDTASAERRGSGSRPAALISEELSGQSVGKERLGCRQLLPTIWHGEGLLDQRIERTAARPRSHYMTVAGATCGC